jgi:hypothetical protein
MKNQWAGIWNVVSLYDCIAMLYRFALRCIVAKNGSLKHTEMGRLKSISCDDILGLHK